MFYWPVVMGHLGGKAGCSAPVVQKNQVACVFVFGGHPCRLTSSYCAWGESCHMGDTQGSEVGMWSTYDFL